MRSRQRIDISGQIGAAAFLAGFDQDHAARMRNLLFSECAQREQRAEHGVAVVGAAAPIQPAVANHRRPGIESLAQPVNSGCLSMWPYMQHACPCDRTPCRHFDEQQRRAAGQAHDLDLHARQGVRFAPLAHQLGGTIHVAVLCPLRIEVRRLVRDADVLAQRRHDGVVPDAVDVAASGVRCS